MKLQMKSKIASIHNKIEITDEEKNPVYHIQSKVISIHNMTYLTRADGTEVATISRKVVSAHETHTIEMSDGRQIELRTELLHMAKDILDLDELGWQIQGNLAQHDYRLVDAANGEKLLAQTHKKWLSIHNTYEIEVFDEEEMDLVVAVLVTLDKILTDRQMTKASMNAAEHPSQE